MATAKKTVSKTVSKTSDTKAKTTVKSSVKKEAPAVEKIESKSSDNSIANLVGSKEAVQEKAEPVSKPVLTPSISAGVSPAKLEAPKTLTINGAGNGVNQRRSTPRVDASGAVEFVGGRKVWRSGANIRQSQPQQPQQNVNFQGEVDGRMIPDAGVPTEEFTGVLDMMRDGNGILRSKFSSSDRDAYISGTQIRRFRLKPGDMVTGPARQPKDNEQYWGLLKVETINGAAPDELDNRVKFEHLTPVYPNEKIVLETEKDILSTRLIDLVAPVGRGQRGMIVSPPKAGKTTILKDIATGVALNYKDVHVMAVLIGERPEEVTDIKRHIEKVTDGKGEVASSNFDEQASEQVRIAELALERAKRLVEMGRHVLIIMDSITRMARAYNLAIPTSGRTLSGGFDPAALYPPKRFFGAARNFEPFESLGKKMTGSLTILGTALIDTGSKMDDLIYEEFKGTGNMELHLDRKLSERRVWPSIDIQRSGTRREDLLFDPGEYQGVILMRRMVDMLDPKEHTQVIVNRMKGTKSNKEFLATLKEG